jgi:hypothetical protein
MKVATAASFTWNRIRTQRVGGKRADQHGKDRAASATTTELGVGPERVVLQQHEVPRVQRRPEIDERQVDRPVVDMVGSLKPRQALQ